MNNFRVTYPPTCTDLAQQVHMFCLPKKEQCFPTLEKGLLIGCADSWNCNLDTNDKEYFIPVQDGDTFMIQIQFFDEGSTDRTNPDTGWTDWLNVQLCDHTGVIKDTSTDSITDIASRYINGWNGTNSYQVIEIDTSLFTTTCFSLRFYSAGGQEICTQQFQRFTPCRDKTATLESTYSGFDCFNNWYGDPLASHGGNFKYSNKLTYFAYMKYMAGPNTTDTFGVNHRITKVENRHEWKLHFQRLIPEYMIEYIKSVILSGNQYYINDIGGYSYNDAEPRPQPNSRMYLPALDFYTTCEKEHGC